MLDLSVLVHTSSYMTTLDRRQLEGQTEDDRIIWVLEFDVDEFDLFDLEFPCPDHGTRICDIRQMGSDLDAILAVGFTPFHKPLLKFDEHEARRISVTHWNVTSIEPVCLIPVNGNLGPAHANTNLNFIASSLRTKQTLATLVPVCPLPDP